MMIGIKSALRKHKIFKELDMLRTLGFLFSVTILFFGFSNYASADDYGERFYNQTPTGMADFTLPDETVDIAMDDIAEDLQDIMPAAGEQADTSPDSEAIDNADEKVETATE